MIRAVTQLFAKEDCTLPQAMFSQFHYQRRWRWWRLGGGAGRFMRALQDEWPALLGRCCTAPTVHRSSEKDLQRAKHWLKGANDKWTIWNVQGIWGGVWFDCVQWGDYTIAELCAKCTFCKGMHFVYFCIIFVCLCFCVRTVLSTMRILCKRVGRWFRRMTLTHSENLGWLIVAVIGNINMLLTIPGGQTLAIAKVCHSSYHTQMLFVKRRPQWCQIRHTEA